MLDFINIAKALSDPNRTRVLMMLTAGELCVCQIIEMLGLAPSTVSKHVSILRQARLVRARKDGRWMYYRLAGRDASAEAGAALKWLKNCLENDKQITADAKVLKRICKMDKTKLCKKYKS